MDSWIRTQSASLPRSGKIEVSASGNTLLITGVAARRIRILAIFLVAASAVTVRFLSGDGSTALTGPMAIAGNGGFVIPFNPAGWFESNNGEGVILNLSGAISVAGSFTYVQEE